jgi:hypothetical protein
LGQTQITEIQLSNENVGRVAYLTLKAQSLDGWLVRQIKSTSSKAIALATTLSVDKMFLKHFSRLFSFSVFIGVKRG